MNSIPCPVCGQMSAPADFPSKSCLACGTPRPGGVENVRVAPLAYAAMFSAVPILFMPFLFPVPLVLGVLALRQIQRTPNYCGGGRAIFALIWSALGALLCVLVALVSLNSR